MMYFLVQNFSREVEQVSESRHFSNLKEHN